MSFPESFLKGAGHLLYGEQRTNLVLTRRALSPFLVNKTRKCWRGHWKSILILPSLHSCPHSHRFSERRYVKMLSGYWKYRSGQSREGSYSSRGNSKCQWRPWVENADAWKQPKLPVSNPSESGRLCGNGQAGGGAQGTWRGQQQSRGLVHILFCSHVSYWSDFCFLPLMPVCWPQCRWRSCGYQGGRPDWYHCPSEKFIRLKRERSGRYNWALFPEPQSWHQILLNEAQTKALFPSWCCPPRPLHGKKFWRKAVRFIFILTSMCFGSGRHIGELCLAASWIVFQIRSCDI